MPLWDKIVDSIHEKHNNYPIRAHFLGFQKHLNSLKIFKSLEAWSVVRIY